MPNEIVRIVYHDLPEEDDVVSIVAIAQMGLLKDHRISIAVKSGYSLAEWTAQEITHNIIYSCGCCVVYLSHVGRAFCIKHKEDRLDEKGNCLIYCCTNNAQSHVKLPNYYKIYLNENHDIDLERGKRIEFIYESDE